MGAITIIVQRISVAKTQEVISKILYTSRYLLAIQVIFGVLVAGILSEPIAKLLFNNEIYNQYILSVRLVIIMSIIILISRSIISIINGRVELKKISIINLSMASVTMVSSYFLISYGDIGLSLIIGSGSVVGIMVGLYFMHKVYFNEISLNVKPTSLSDLLKSAPVSIWLILHPLVISMSLLGVQSLVGQYYGLDSLGLYAAVMLIETTFLGLLMAAMSSYFMPTLGKIESVDDKSIFINKVITMLLAITVPFVVVMAILGKYVLSILFSSEFESASSLLLVQSLSLITAIFCWVYANYFIHNGNYRAYFIVDFVWVILLVSGIFYVAIKKFPLIYIAWTYLAMAIVSFAMYQLIIVKLYGSGLIDKKNIFIALVSIFGTILIGFFN